MVIRPSLEQMLDPAAAQARVPVTPERGAPVTTPPANSAIGLPERRFPEIEERPLHAGTATTARPAAASTMKPDSAAVLRGRQFDLRGATSRRTIVRCHAGSRIQVYVSPDRSRRRERCAAGPVSA